MNRRAWAAQVLALAVGCRARTESAPVDAGRAAARRVVSLSPSTTEAMFALGAGARLVGRSRYCDFPDEARRLPSVGGYVDPNFEAILGLAPDLVVGARGPSGRTLTDRLAERGIATYFPSTESMAEIDAMILGLGERVGTAQAAALVVDRLRARRGALAAAVKDLPRPRALLVFGLAPVVVAGPGGFPDELLRLAGADNAVREGTAYPTLGMERVLALDPDVIVDAEMAEAHGARITLETPGFRDLRAVKQGKVVPLYDEAVLRPGPRVADGLATLVRALHPEARLP